MNLLFFAKENSIPFMQMLNSFCFKTYRTKREPEILKSFCFSEFCFIVIFLSALLHATLVNCMLFLFYFFHRDGGKKHGLLTVGALDAATDNIKIDNLGTAQKSDNKR